jgi:DNA-binding NarL/FixJ family response regulator
MPPKRARLLIARPAVEGAPRLNAAHLSVKEVSHINELISEMSIRRPAVLILFHRFPGLDEFGGIRQLRRLSPTTRIIVVSDDANDQEELQVLRLGAKGYCGTVDAGVLLKMIEKVQQGEIWAGRKTIGALLDEFYGEGEVTREVENEWAGDEKLKKLTDREQEILRHLADGLANKEIAVALNVSVPTVKAHLTNMFRKLDQPDRLHLALYAAAKRRLSH